MDVAYRLGAQQALWQLKLATFDPGQLELLRQHWPGVTPAQVLELNRARALSLPAPESARVLGKVNLRRAAQGVPTTPWVQEGWLPGRTEPMPLRGATPKEQFLNRLFGPPPSPTPAPAPLQSLAPYRADIPAAPPLTRQQRFSGSPTQAVTPSQIVDVAPAASAASQVSRVSRAVPVTEGTAARVPHALRLIRRALGRKIGLG